MNNDGSPLVRPGECVSARRSGVGRTSFARAGRARARCAVTLVAFTLPALQSLGKRGSGGTSRGAVPAMHGTCKSCKSCRLYRACPAKPRRSRVGCATPRRLERGKGSEWRPGLSRLSPLQRSHSGGGWQLGTSVNFTFLPGTGRGTARSAVEGLARAGHRSRWQPGTSVNLTPLGEGS